MEKKSSQTNYTTKMINCRYGGALIFPFMRELVVGKRKYRRAEAVTNCGRERDERAE